MNPLFKTLLVLFVTVGTVIGVVYSVSLASHGIPTVDDTYLRRDGSLDMQGELSLPNNIFLRGRNQANNAYVDLVKINASDEIEFGADLSASTVTGDLTLEDNVHLTLGTGGDADLSYNGSNVIWDTAVVGTGNLILSDELGIKGGTAFTMTIGGTPSANRTWTLQNASDTLVGLTTSDTLTNKTITSPTITGTIGGNPTITSPTITGTIGGNPIITSPDINGGTWNGTIDAASIIATSITYNDFVEARFGTAGDATIEYNGTNLIVNPDAVGSGALVVEGPADLEGYTVVGNGSALNTNHTLLVTRPFTTSGFGSQLLVRGSMVVDSGTSNAAHAQIGQTGFASISLNSGGVHPVVATLILAEPNIIETTGTVTTAATVYIENAPSEGDDNYALLVNAGESHFGGNITFNDNINAVFGTGGDATIDYNGTNLIVNPDAVGSGALVVEGQIDIEGYVAIGNGVALSSDRTLIVDRDFSDAGAPSQFAVQGIVTITGGSSDLYMSQFGRSCCSQIDLQSGGFHSFISTVIIWEPSITETTGTVSTASSLLIAGAPTEGDFNYALLVTSGVARFDGSIMIGSNAVNADSGSQYLVFGDGTALNPGPDNAGLYADDVATVMEMFAVDENGSATQISPHPGDFLDTLDLECPSPWAFNSSNPYLGVRVLVDWCGVIMALEALTGEQFMFFEEFEPIPWDQEDEPSRWLADRGVGR